MNKVAMVLVGVLVLSLFTVGCSSAQKPAGAELASPAEIPDFSGWNIIETSEIGTDYNWLVVKVLDDPNTSITPDGILFQGIGGRTEAFEWWPTARASGWKLFVRTQQEDYLDWTEVEYFEWNIGAARGGEENGMALIPTIYLSFTPLNSKR